MCAAPIRNDEWYMTQALKLAQKAARLGEVPIGAVVVDAHGSIIGRGYNAVERFGSQQEHAEMRALRQACRKVGDWRLDGAIVYVTLEPCKMCVYAIALSRCKEIVYGAASPLFGSKFKKEQEMSLYTKHLQEVRGGVLRDRASDMLRSFFKQKRGVDHEKFKGTDKKGFAQAKRSDRI